MKNRSTLKAVLNRQLVALGSYMPLESGLFDCRKDADLGSRAKTISFKPFERAYPLMKEADSLPVETR